jgi:integrase
MAVKKFYSNKEKAGWRWDAARKQFWSWGFDIRLGNGARRRESGFSSRQIAEQAVAQIRVSEKEGKYDLQTRKFPLISEVLEKHLERIENKKERVRSETVFNRWLTMLPKRLRFNELAPAHIRLYIDERAQEIKASSINREVTCLASAIHAAHVNFPELAGFPTPKIPRPKVEQSRRERLITQEEVMKVLTHLLSPRQKDESATEHRRRVVVGQVFQMALLTGARVGEIIALRWSQIDYEARILQIVGTKTRFKSAKTVRYLEITPSIEAILKDRETYRSDNPKQRGKVCEFVFSKTGNSVTKYHQILRAAAKAVGVTYGADIKGGFITHDARHTAVTRMLQAGVDLSTVGAITGHTDANLILHYSHATRESRKKATSILENFVTESKKKAG